MKKIFSRLRYVFLIAVVALISLIVIALISWFLLAVTYGYTFIVILAVLVGIGFGVFKEIETCCRKWSLKPKLVLLVAFLPMFCLSALYLASVLYRITTKEYNGFMSGISASLDISLSLPLSITFLGTVVLIFLSCVIFGALAKRSKK